MKIDPAGDYYAREAERLARGPQLYGGDAQVASLRAFHRYHKDAHVDITDGDGLTRWLAPKQVRVFGIVHRIAMSPTGTAKMVDIALEAGCTTSTVSRTIQKLERWAMYAVEIRRGRHGGITVHRKGWDRFYDYVREARKRLHNARVKLASTLRRGNETPPSPSTVMDATFSGPRLITFASKVLYERAMLALDDPEGEYEAVHPVLDPNEAISQAEDERRRRDAAIREAALNGDWQKWEDLRRERWDG